jgi:aminoglycoside 6-adenylyltransferase
MPDPVPEERVLERLVAWGEAQPAIRAMVLTGSRAGPGEWADRLSDYDVILFVTDAAGFARDDAWTAAYGPPLVRWGDERDLYGHMTYFRGVVYEDGVKVDWSVWPEALLERVADTAPGSPDRLDLGYRVLLDKDGRTSRWAPPAYRAHIPARPTEPEYRALVEEFWWGTTYAAKSLWRGELVFAKFVLDYDIKLGALRRLLEWRIELDHDWSLVPGKLGRGLERRLPADVWAELAGTYVGPAIEENWAALFRTSALFSRVANEVADALGYAYPQDVEDGVAAQVRAVRRLPRGG